MGTIPSKNASRRGAPMPRLVSPRVVPGAPIADQGFPPKPRWRPGLAGPRSSQARRSPYAAYLAALARICG
jgi:hypothetical protein